ncbi:MAG: DUF2868 domain-containing protein [Halioglobus sp.]
MNNGVSTPGLADLYHLGEQIELDQEAPLHDLRQRDHDIGRRCKAADDAARLMFWLRQLSTTAGSASGGEERWLTEASAAVVARSVALVLGFVGMASFLLSGGQGLVNVFVFLLLFVLVQILFCLFSAIVMFRSVRGNAPVVLPVNPARLVISRAFPDKRYLRESQSAVRLLVLRYGQEMGAIFTMGAVAAFFLVLAFSPFTFVWGSTFGVSDAFVRGLTNVLAAPWSSWLPAATVSPQLIADSRFHPAVSGLSQVNVASMGGWWPFLIMSMLTYALLPRMILWGLSRWFYVKLMNQSLARYPGSAGILARMKAPVVQTQAVEPEDDSPRTPGSVLPVDDGLLLLNWAGTLGTGEPDSYEQLLAVPPGNRLAAGLGSLADDAVSVDKINQYKPEQLLVAVKSWEPPMADLLDFLERVVGVTHCTVSLVPLPRRSVAEHNLQEWRDFSRGLPFAVTDTQVLSRV